MIRFDDRIYTLYHVALSDSGHIAFYLDHPRWRYGLFDSLLFSGTRVVDSPDFSLASSPYVHYHPLI